MLFLLTVHIRPIIRYCSCVWATGYQGDLRLFESVLRRWTKQLSLVMGLGYADKLHTLNLHSMKGRLMMADLIQCWKIFHGKSCIAPKNLFVLSPHRHTRGHCYKIFMRTANTDVRKRFFMWSVCLPGMLCHITFHSSHLVFLQELAGKISRECSVRLCRVRSGIWFNVVICFESYWIL